MLIPLGVTIYFDYFADHTLYPQSTASLSFVFTLVLTALLGLIFYGIGRKGSGQLFRKEGLLVVVLIWIFTPAIASLPFLFSGTVENPLIAYFEMVSGLTTTGATAFDAKQYNEVGVEVPIRTIVPGIVSTIYEHFGTIKPVATHKGIEAINMGLLFWRSFIQWLGGGGVMVLFVALLPAIGGGGKILFTSEMTGPLKDPLTPRVRETAIRLWKIYAGLTFLEILFLIATNDTMKLFDAITISFSTISTGGFSIKNTSIGFYENANTEWVVMFFMVLGAINFSLYYSMVKGRFYRLYDWELLLFILSILGSCALGSWLLLGQPKILLTGDPHENYFFGDAIRYGFFQIVSAHTTTGFVTSNFELWPFITQGLMLIVMFFGGMSGSTAAGIKIIRLIILFRFAQYKVESIYKPDAVRTLRIAGKEIDHSLSSMVLCFFTIIISFSVLGVFLFVLNGVDPETSLGMVASLVNNVGIAFRAAGPVESFAFLSDFGLVLSSILMILGRLEFFVVLAIFIPDFWKKNT